MGERVSRGKVRRRKTGGRKKGKVLVERKTGGGTDGCWVKGKKYRKRSVRWERKGKIIARMKR